MQVPVPVPVLGVNLRRVLAVALILAAAAWLGVVPALCLRRAWALSVEVAALRARLEAHEALPPPAAPAPRRFGLHTDTDSRGLR